MDLVDWSEEAFNQIKNDYKQFASKLNVKDVNFIPISALLGDNVVNESENMNWYKGSTLMYHLENVHIANDHNHIDSRFPVQTVIRPHSDEYHDYRGYAGRVAGGIFKKGDDITVLPSGFTSKIKEVETAGTPLEEAYSPMSITMTLEDNIDVSRGDMIVRTGNMPEISQDIDAMVCWMDEKNPIRINGKYTLIHTSRNCRCIIKEVVYKMDVNNLHKLEDDKEIHLNDIGRIRLRTTQPIFFDAYNRNRITGSFILVDEGSNVTVGACMIRS
jgi:sulfate adenylyltransferase subunit 1